jgi:hypothetical protein
MIFASLLHLRSRASATGARLEVIPLKLRAALLERTSADLESV